MQEALTQIATQVRDILQNDSYTTQIVPDYLREAVTAYPLRGGKMLRPALLSWACGAAGGDPGKVLHAAAAVELFHTWTLVHDDIIDCDELRRGKPAVHALVRDDAQQRFAGILPNRAERFGRDMAILAGDIQQAWANHLMLRARHDGIPDAIVLVALDRMNGQLNPGLIGGEAVDVEFELRPFDAISTGEILEMLRRKTALLLRYAAETGAMFATHDPDHPHVKVLGVFAERCGLAFQLRDDVLGMFGDPASLGKPIGSDLRQGKRTLLFAAALERLDGAEREELLAALGNPALDPPAVARIASLLRGSGAVAWVEDMAEAFAAEAADQLATLPASSWRDLLQQWGDYVLTRAY